MEFSSREVALEQEMTERGADRLRAGISKAQSMGRESLTTAGHQIVRAAMPRMYRALKDWTKEQARLTPTKRSTAMLAFADVPLKVACLLALRTILDGACAGRGYSAVCHAIGKRLDEERMARWLSVNHRGSWDTARRRATIIPERAMARLRKAVLKSAREHGYVRLTLTARLRAGMILTEVAHRASGIVTLESTRVGRRRRMIQFRLHPETANWIALAHSHNEFLEPFYMPMVDPPGDWGPGQNGGYATDLVRREYLVKNRSKRTRELVAEAEMPDVYAAVNALQRTAWQVNPATLEVARTLWESGETCPGLARAEDDPYPPEPAEDAPRPVRADWLRKRFLVRRENLFRASRRVEAARVLWLAGRLATEGAIYYPQQLDFRGRIYPIPAFLQPQGPDLARGLLRFADGDWLADPPQEAPFWQHGANCFGYDKLTVSERCERIAGHAPDILRVYRDPLDCRWWQEADEPWQFLAWCLEAGELLETGRVRTHVPCYVDGSNNGLQILSLLLRDPVGGAATNCLPSDHRHDVYQDVADEVTRRLRELDDDDARAWIAWFPEGRLPRAATKRSVMTLPYGCSRWSSKRYVMDWFEEELRQGARSPWGTDPYWARVRRLGELVWESIEVVVGRAMGCMNWLRELARLTVEQGVAPVWTAPSGFVVRQGYTNQNTLQVRAKFGERIRMVQSARRGNMLVMRRHVNAMAPNFVHSLDAAVLARVVARWSRAGRGPVSTIHDSFGARATEMEALGVLVREEYARMFSEEDLLEKLRTELRTLCGGRVEFPQPPERGDLDPRAVVGSRYLFS